MKKFQYVTQITLTVLISLFYSTFTFAFPSPDSDPLPINCQLTLLKLKKYSLEDVPEIVELAYEGSVTEVVNSLYIPYPIVLSWIYQHDRRISDEESIPFSQTYKDGAIDFAIKIAPSEVARLIHMTYADLTISIKDKYGSIENARRVERGGRVSYEELKYQAMRSAEEIGITDTADQLNIPFADVFSWYHIRFGFSRAMNRL